MELVEWKDERISPGLRLMTTDVFGVFFRFFKIRKYLGSEHVFSLNLHMLIFRLVLLILLSTTHAIE